MDISEFDTGDISMLDGCTIGTLDMEGMGLTEIPDLSGVKVSNIDIAHNPDIATLEPLAGYSGMESVTISQDMLDKTGPLTDAGITVKVVS